MQSLLKGLLYRLGYSIKRIRPVRRAGPAASADRAADPATLLGLLHRVDPYEGFPYEDYPDDPSGWGSDSPAFAGILESVRPRRLVVEVGTWKGGSAITMARALRDLGSDARILCIDTWLGALEFWTDQDDASRYGALALRHGYPSVYYQFLANVCHAGLRDRIVPFPQTSATAALWLRCQGLSAEAIYIDGSHEEEDVYQDLADYWEVLEPGGVIFGDDYAWDGVRLAVDRFARERRLEVGFDADKWVLRRSR